MFDPIETKKKTCNKSPKFFVEIFQFSEQDIGYMAPPMGRKLMGRVFVTNYRLRFESSGEHLSASGDNYRVNFNYFILNFSNIFLIIFYLIFQKCIVNVALGCIEKIEKYGGKTMARDEDSYGGLPKL